MSKKQKNPAKIPVRELEHKSAADSLLFYLLLITLVFVPLIVRLVLLDHASPSISETVLDTGTKADFFSYDKLILLGILTMFIVAVFLFKVLSKHYVLPGGLNNTATAALFLLVLLSGLFSDLKTISLLGQFDRHEGTIAVFCYLILFFVAANLVYPRQKVDLFFYALFPFIILNSILGIIHLFGYNILDSDFVISLVLPSNLPRSGLGPSSYISSTLSNPDYISGIGGVLTILFLTRAIFESRLKHKILWSASSVLSFSLVLTSFATSGFFSIVVVMPVILILLFFRSRRKQGFITLGAILSCFVLLFFLYNIQDSRVAGKSIGFFMGIAKGGQSLSSGMNEGPKDESSSSEITQPSSNPDFNLPPTGWAAGSGRLYIWRRTLPLIAQHPIFGYGSDTFSYYFPQDDPYKNSGLADPNIVVDKPHNMYLNLAFGSGVLSLLAFLILVFNHLTGLVKLFKNRIDNHSLVVSTSLFTGLLAYLIQGLFNESVVGSAPMFWILFGVSVSLLAQETKRQVG